MPMLFGDVVFNRVLLSTAADIDGLDIVSVSLDSVGLQTVGSTSTTRKTKRNK
jgi:hypothetical protein